MFDIAYWVVPKKIYTLPTEKILPSREGGGESSEEFSYICIGCLGRGGVLLISCVEGMDFFWNNLLMSNTF